MSSLFRYGWKEVIRSRATIIVAVAVALFTAPWSLELSWSLWKNKPSLAMHIVHTNLYHLALWDTWQRYCIHCWPAPHCQSLAWQHPPWRDWQDWLRNIHTLAWQHTQQPAVSDALVLGDTDTDLFQVGLLHWGMLEDCMIDYRDLNKMCRTGCMEKDTFNLLLFECSKLTIFLNSKRSIELTEVNIAASWD